MTIAPRQLWRHPSGRLVSVLAVDDGPAPWVEIRDERTGQRLTMRASTLVEGYEREPEEVHR